MKKLRKWEVDNLVALYRDRLIAGYGIKNAYRIVHQLKLALKKIKEQK